MQEGYMSAAMIRERIADCEGLSKKVTETPDGIRVWDRTARRWLSFRPADTLDVADVFEFGSLPVDRENFLTAVRCCLAPWELALVAKVIFVNSMEERRAVAARFPHQTINWRALGTHLFEDNVVLVNVMNIKTAVIEEMEEDILLTGYPLASPADEMHRGIWETVVHEIRHNCVENPLIYDNELPLAENLEDAIEHYARQRYREAVLPCRESWCFSFGDLRPRSSSAA